MSGENTRLVVAGRTFRPVTPATLKHYQYVTAPLLAAGALEADTIAEQVAAITEAGKGADLLAGLYTEEGPDGEPRAWVLREAKRTAAGFEGITDPNEWNAMTLALFVGLRRFFGSALDSSTTTPTSSGETITEEPGAPVNNEPELSGSPSSP